jgi:hypothetical protein
MEDASIVPTEFPISRFACAPDVPVTTVGFEARRSVDQRDGEICLSNAGRYRRRAIADSANVERHRRAVQPGDAEAALLIGHGSLRSTRHGDLCGADRLTRA